MEHEVEVDITEATYRAEEMFGGLTVTTIKLVDFSAAIAVMVNTMAKEYKVDNMVLVEYVEKMAVAIAEEEL